MLTKVLLSVVIVLAIILTIQLASVPADNSRAQAASFSGIWLTEDATGSDIERVEIQIIGPIIFIRIWVNPSKVLGEWHTNVSDAEDGIVSIDCEASEFDGLSFTLISDSRLEIKEHIRPKPGVPAYYRFDQLRKVEEME